jgi:hypothetical protein
MSPRFSSSDIHGVALDLINTILTKLESAGSPEKVAENDFLMKCKCRLVHIIAWLYDHSRRHENHYDRPTIACCYWVRADTPAASWNPWRYLQKPEQSQFRPVYL